MNVHPLLSVALGILAAFAGGWMLTYADVPLGWILGAMAGSAIFTNTIGLTGKTRNVRRAGQLLVGTATAGILTPEILIIIMDLLPAMIGAAIAANLFGFVLSWPLARIARTDRLTALLAALPAGMAEMSSLAKEVGARTEIVTVAHTLRVILVVLFVPFLLQAQPAGTVAAEPANGTYAALAACLVLGWLAAMLATRLRLLNPFIIMPMVLGVLLVGAGFPVARMPEPLLIAAQVFIGFSLGARLKRQDFSRLPRAAAAGVVCGLGLIGFMTLLFAPFLRWLTGTDIASLTLGVAPGGLGEMVASAKALGASAAIVAGFQFVRSFLTNMIVPPLVVRFGARPSSKGTSDENR